MQKLHHMLIGRAKCNRPLLFQDQLKLLHNFDARDEVGVAVPGPPPLLHRFDRQQLAFFHRYSSDKRGSRSPLSPAVFFIKSSAGINVVLQELYGHRTPSLESRHGIDPRHRHCVATTKVAGASVQNLLRHYQKAFHFKPSHKQRQAGQSVGQGSV